MSWGSANVVLAQIGPIDWLSCSSDGESARLPAEVLSEAIRRCESPIERVMLGAIVEALRTAPVSWWRVRTAAAWATAGEPRRSGGRWLEVAPQESIGRYRADFVVTAAEVGFDGSEVSRSVVVECDGHQHHNANRAQVERDRKRDREMQDGGFVVLRYPGSAVWADALGHAREAVAAALNALARAQGFEREAAE